MAMDGSTRPEEELHTIVNSTSQEQRRDKPSQSNEITTDRMPPPRSRKKAQAVPQRRVAVQDDDGWTHITNTRRVATTATTTTTKATTDQLIPAEIPDGLTLSQLRAQFDAHQEKWLASQTWKALAASPIASNNSNDNNDNKIDKFICIGLGSPSGFLRSGLVDRRAVSLFQLAAFISLIDLLSPDNNTRTYSTYPFSNLFFFLAFSLAFALLKNIIILKYPMSTRSLN